MRKHVNTNHTRKRPESSLVYVLLLGLVLLCKGAFATKPTATRPLIVIDPGHGGANLGAAGQRIREKQLTLRLGLRLGKVLTEHGYRVVLTRSTDRYLSLRERGRLANRLEPALFLSIHGNASPDHSQRGVETYVLDPTVSEIEARRQGRQVGGAVSALLADVRAEYLQKESIRLGRAIQESLLSRPSRKGGTGPSAPSQAIVDRGLRQNDFDVLSGINAPAVLVEVGFIDHVVEGALLSEPEIQEELVQALFLGIERYFNPAADPGS